MFPREEQLERVTHAHACDQEQGGWVTYSITNPLTGELQAKISYVVPLDDNRLLGCGCYLNSEWLHV